MWGGGGEGKNLLGCGALKWYDTDSGRVRFPNDEVTQRERYWARRKSEYSIQENTSVPVTSMAYLKTFPSQPPSLFTATFR